MQFKSNFARKLEAISNDIASAVSDYSSLKSAAAGDLEKIAGFRRYDASAYDSYSGIEEFAELAIEYRNSAKRFNLLLEKRINEAKRFAALKNRQELNQEISARKQAETKLEAEKKQNSEKIDYLASAVRMIINENQTNQKYGSWLSRTSDFNLSLFLEELGYIPKYNHILSVLKGDTKEKAWLERIIRAEKEIESLICRSEFACPGQEIEFLRKLKYGIETGLRHGYSAFRLGDSEEKKDICTRFARKIGDYISSSERIAA